MIVNLDEIRRAHERFIEKNERLLDESADFLGEGAIVNVRRSPTFTPRTGKLQDSTEYDKLVRVSGRLVRIRNTAPYALPIEEGAKPHVIEARRKPFLVFKGRDGNWVRKKRVNHPGNKAYWFLKRAMWSAVNDTVEFVKDGMDRIAKQF